MSVVQPQSVGVSKFGLEKDGIRNLAREYWNLPTAALYEEAIRRGEGNMGHLGPMVVRTGKHTGRAARDKTFMQEPSSIDKIDWGKVNEPIDAEGWKWLHKKVIAYFQNRDAYVMDAKRGDIALRPVRARLGHAPGDGLDGDRELV